MEEGSHEELMRLDRKSAAMFRLADGEVPVKTDVSLQSGGVKPCGKVTVQHSSGRNRPASLRIASISSVEMPEMIEAISSVG